MINVRLLLGSGSDLIKSSDIAALSVPRHWIIEKTGNRKCWCGGVNEDWQWGGVIVVAGFPMLGADFYCLIHFILPHIILKATLCKMCNIC